MSWFYIPSRAQQAAGSSNGPYQYWRVYITANDGSGLYNGIANLELFDGATDRAFNLSLGNYTASSELIPQVAAYQVGDHDNNSRWLTSTNSVPAWVAINLDAQYTLTSYAIRASHAESGTAPSAFQLQGNNTSAASGAPWVNVNSQSGQTGWALSERRVYTL